MTTVRYQHSEQEVIKCLLKARRLNHPWESIRGTVIVSVSVCLYIVHHVYRKGGTPVEVALWGCGAALLSGGMFNALIKNAVRRAFVRAVRGNPDLYTSPQTLSFDHEKLEIATPATRNEFAWSVFKRCIQDEQEIYLLSGAGGFFAIVAKRAFTADELAEFLRCSQSLSTT